MKWKVKKGPILLPLLLAAAILVGIAVFTRLSRETSAEHTDLGQKYLNELNYSGAVGQFLESLSLDPMDASARLGLAQAYLGMEETEQVPQVLQPLTDSGNPDAYRLLVQVHQEEQDMDAALITAQSLVERTDNEEDYAMRDELLGQVLVQPHSIAQGTDQVLVLLDSTVYSAGRNTLGQLGTPQGLATDIVQESVLPAGFSGQPSRVYCAGRTSYVVDQDGNLWAAGENRWGQMGLGYASATPKAGWSRLTDSGGVAAVAGTAGSLLVLKLDGSLWYAGQGGVLTLERMAQFYTVSSIASYGDTAAVLTADGTLYEANGSDLSAWSRVAQKVKQFSLGQGGLVWVTVDNLLGSQQGYAAPDGWTTGEDGATPSFRVRQAASDGRGLLLLDGDGMLHRLYDGTLYDLEQSAQCVYSAGEWAVSEGDGGLQLWNLSQSFPQNTPSF